MTPYERSAAVLKVVEQTLADGVRCPSNHRIAMIVGRGMTESMAGKTLQRLHADGVVTIRRLGNVRHVIAKGGPLPKIAIPTRGCLMCDTQIPANNKKRYCSDECRRDADERRRGGDIVGMSEEGASKELLRLLLQYGLRNDRDLGMGRDAFFLAVEREGVSL